MRKTNPIWPCRGRLTEEIVRNEAKLRWIGVYGQRQLSCGPWLGRGVKRAKRTQFGPGRPMAPEDKCAKRTQFGPAAGVWRKESRKTNQNLRELGYVGNGGCPVGRGSAGE
jgi:hypothetical protein